MLRHLLRALLILVLLCSGLSAVQAASYTFTPIDVPGARSTIPSGINTAGQIVGWFDAVTRVDGFLTDGATFTTITVPSAAATQAFGINAAGQIVGQFRDAAGEYHGFLKDGATYTTIDVPRATTTWAYGINDVGQIVGTFQDATGLSDLTEHVHGFLKDCDTFTIIDVPGAATTQVYGINTAGQIVGGFDDTMGHIKGFLTDGATFTIIDVPSSTNTWAYGINTAGQIVGQFDDYTEYPAYPHGFLKDGATFTTIDVPGARSTYLQGINVVGQLVGWIFDATRDGFHGFLATPQVIVVTIDIQPGSDPASINPKSNGKIPVAILTTDTFDATTVNAATVRFGKTGKEALPVQVAVEDVNGDGRPDLLLTFNIPATGITCGATSASLTGETQSRQAITGTDAIQTVRCK
jgi:probable HAF family extracellular repeat protein